MKQSRKRECPSCHVTYIVVQEEDDNKRPTKNLDSLIAAINMSGATVSISQHGSFGRWNVFIHDDIDSNVLAFHTTANGEKESMYSAVKSAVKLVKDRVISLCGYQQTAI